MTNKQTTWTPEIPEFALVETCSTEPTPMWEAVRKEIYAVNGIRYDGESMLKLDSFRFAVMSLAATRSQVSSGTGEDYDGPPNNLDCNTERQVQRFLSTLKKLQRTGYCCEKDPNDFLQKMTELSPGSVFALTHSGTNHFSEEWMSKALVEKTYRDEIENIWGASLLMYATAHFPEALFNEKYSNYAALIRPNVKDVYLLAACNLNTALLQAAGMAAKTDLEAMANAHEKTRQKLADLRAAQRDASGSMPRINTLQAQLQAKETAYNDLYQKFVNQNRRLQYLERQNAAEADEQPTDLEQPVPTEQSRNESAPSTDNMYSDPDNATDAEQLPNEIPPFPEDSRCVVLGGHPNLLRKLRLLHPNWNYISADSGVSRSTQTGALKKVSVVIVFNKYLSHKLYWTALNKIDSDVPKIYIDLVSMERIEEKIQSQWIAHFVDKATID